MSSIYGFFGGSHSPSTSLIVDGEIILCVEEERLTRIKSGDNYGRLTILKEVEPHRKPSGQTQRQFSCKCECGNEIITKLFYLTNGETKSCGCLNLELIKKRSITHNLSKTKEYKNWLHMKERCYNSNTKGYEYWGGRGIKVCDKWLNSFENFLSHLLYRNFCKRSSPIT